MNLKKSLFWLVSAGLFFLVAPSIRAVTAGDFSGIASGGGIAAGPKVLWNGYLLPFRWYVPSGYNPGTAYPLVIFLHGSGEMGADNADQLSSNGNYSFKLLENANHPAFMVAPQLPSGAWTGKQYQTMIQEILAAMQANYNIDPDRIYVTGLSYGAAGTWGLLYNNPNQFAAAIPIAGVNNYKDYDVSTNGYVATHSDRVDLIADYADVPMWLFHGGADTTQGTGNSQVSSERARWRGFNPLYTEYPGQAHVPTWEYAYKTLGLTDWLFSQVRGQPDTTQPVIQITSQGGASTHLTSSNSITLSGNTNLNALHTATPPPSGYPAGNIGPVSSVTWKVLDPFDKSVPITVLSSGNATNTGTAFSTWTANVTLNQGENLIEVIASAPCWSTRTGGGTTTFVDTIRVTYRPSGAETTAPTVNITSPAPPTSSTSNSTIAISGNSSDASGIVNVQWSNDRGGTGIAASTSGNWTLPETPLQPGTNVITVSARDIYNNIGTATLTVTRTGAPDATKPVLQITAPSSSVAYTTTASTVNISGSVTDAGGSISAVKYHCTASNSTAFSSATYTSGNNSWNANNVPLAMGKNYISVVAYDGVAGNYGADFIEITRTVTPTNQAPVVNVGSDQSVSLGNTLALTPTVTDDGLPGGTLTYAWTRQSGSGNVTFTPNSTSKNVTANFTATGNYVLRLTANDTSLSSFDELTVTVNAANQAPSVNVGADQTVAISTGATLTPTVTDDGLPGGTLSYAWTKQSGTGNVSFTPNSTSKNVTANFSATGTYTLRLTANDTALSSFDELSVLAVQATNLTSYSLSGNNVGTASGSSLDLDGTNWQVEGVGNGMGGSADNIHQEKKAVTGDFTAVVKVVSLAGNSTERAGLAVRESTAAGARMAALSIASSGNVSSLGRTTVSGNATTPVSGGQLSLGSAWLLIRRVGDELITASGSDGTNFTEVSRYNISGLSSAVDVGLWAAGGGGSTNAQAVFTSFSSDLDLISLWQDFEIPGATISTYVDNTSPTYGRFDNIDTALMSITSGKLRMVRTGASTGSGSNRFQQSGGFAPTKAVVTVKLGISNVTGSTTANLAYLDLGSMNSTTYNDYSIATGNSVLANRLTIRAGSGAGNFRFRINATDGATSYSGNGTVVTVQWFINHTGASINYTAPNGSTESLAYQTKGCSDLWVNGVKILNDIERSPNYAIDGMGAVRLRSDTTVPITLDIDEIEVRELETVP